MKNLPAGLVAPPGDLLREELERRNWSQADLAAILQRPPRLVNEIIKGKRGITAETAHGLGLVFETGPEFWMNLETLYQLSQVQVQRDPITRRAKIFGRFPVKEMQRRGWIPQASTLKTLEQALLSFYQIESVESPLVFAHAAKKTSYDKLTALQAAWLARARQLAQRTQVSPFREGDFDALLKAVKSCVMRVDDAARIPSLLAANGIRLVLLEPLPGSKMDGACFWLEKDEPAIALSLRFDRHDIFCHAIFHELDHVKHKEGQRRPLLDVDLLSPDLAGQDMEIENRANSHAAENLIPERELRSFIQQAAGHYSESKIVAFAHDMRVHPGIVVGRLQHLELIHWSSFSGLRAKIKATIVDAAVTEGFGKVVR